MREPIGYRVLIDQPGYDEDVLIWRGGFRRETIQLCILKRKIDMARKLGLGVSAAYSVRNLGTNLIEERYGRAMKFVIEPFYVEEGS